MTSTSLQTWTSQRSGHDPTESLTSAKFPCLLVTGRKTHTQNLDFTKPAVPASCQAKQMLVQMINCALCKLWSSTFYTNNTNPSSHDLKRFLKKVWNIKGNSYSAKDRQKFLFRLYWGSWGRYLLVIVTVRELWSSKADDFQYDDGQ